MHSPTQSTRLETKKDDEPVKPVPATPKSAAKTPPAPPPDPHSINAAPKRFKNDLRERQEQVAQARTDLDTAGREAEAWARLGTNPTLDQGAKDLFVSPHLAHWSGEVTRLKNLLAKLEQECRFLEALVKLVDERTTQPVD